MPHSDDLPDPFSSPLAPPEEEAAAPTDTGPPEDLRQAWAWVPTLYFAEGIPYVIVMSVSVLMYKSLGIDNDRIALYTSLLYLPWVIKPLWSPIVDVVATTRLWIVFTQLLIAGGFLGIAAVLGSPSFFTLTLAFLWLLAIGSATHDIAADGFYMAGLSKKSQSWFVGIRSTFYRLAMIAGQGGLVMLAGSLEERLPAPTAWAWTMAAAAAMFGGLAAYHQFALPRPAKQENRQRPSGAQILQELVESVTTFFQKPGVGIAVAYILIYRFAEAQLGKIAPAFLKDDIAVGGLGMTTYAVGKIYGLVGVALLLTGGILGGLLGAKYGLRRCMLPMAAAINIPNVVYVLLALFKPSSIWLIGTAVAFEQFGYGFGFAGYMLLMLYVSRGEHETAHFALCTGLMALGMMLPGMFSGKLQLAVGYEWFFVWVLLATIPSFAVTLLMRNHVKE